MATARHLAADGSFFVNIKAHAEDGQRHLYVFDLVVAHARRWSWLFKDDLVWFKRSMPGEWPDRFRNDWEPVFHFAPSKAIKFRPMNVVHESDACRSYAPNGGRTFGGNIGIGDIGHVSGLARPGNVIEISTRENPDGNAHSAAFPPRLPEFFIKAFSDAGDLVVDPFLGSGSTLIAAAKTGRVARGFEISPRYCDVIRRRWTKYARSAGIDPGAGALD